METARTHFCDRLVAAIDACGAPACVGLDPVLERLPEILRPDGVEPVGAIAGFCRGVLDAAAGVVPAVKFQSACFERYGGAGVAAMRDLIRAARGLGFVVILDAKRGDIGLTAEHYATACLDGDSGTDAVTLNGYLGMETIEPFLRPGKGVFVLVRTSNPGGDALQSARLEGGRTVAEAMADQVASVGAGRLGECGLSDVGAVVGATKADEGRALRERMPKQFFLVPGFGAQGGTAEDVRALLRPGGGPSGVLVTASRSVIYAFDSSDTDWRKAVASAARQLVGSLAGL